MNLVRKILAVVFRGMFLADNGVFLSFATPHLYGYYAGLSGEPTYFVFWGNKGKGKYLVVVTLFASFLVCDMIWSKYCLE